MPRILPFSFPGLIPQLRSRQAPQLLRSAAQRAKKAQDILPLSTIRRMSDGVCFRNEARLGASITQELPA
jgi:hypothetical protein